MDYKKMLAEAKARRQQAWDAMAEADKMLEKAIDMMTGSGKEEDEKKAAELEQEATKIHASALASKKMAVANYNNASDDVQRIADAMAKAAEPVYPGSLPTGGDEGADLGDGQQNGKDKPPENVAQKAIYQMRYGTMNAEVKAVINDLYGGSYEQDRYNQRIAFFNYIRHRDEAIDPNGRRLLKAFIPTESFILQAIKNGWDIPKIKATMVEAIDTLGGYTVPVDIQEDIISREPGFSVMNGRARQRDTGRDRVQIVKRTGGDDQYIGNVRVTWAEETPAAATTTETNATFGLEDIAVNTGMAVAPLSKNLLEDSMGNMTEYLTEEFSAATAIAKDNTYLIGTGVGQPQGILVGGTTPVTGVTAVNSGDANLLTFDGVIAMTFGVASQYKQGTRQGPNGAETRAGFIANRSTYQAIAQLKDADAAYLWTELRGNNAVGQPNTLRGYNVWEQEAMPDVAAGAYPLLFGNPEAYEIVNRIGMTVQRYDVSPGQNLLYFELRFRVGGQVVRPWMICAQLISA